MVKWKCVVLVMVVSGDDFYMSTPPLLPPFGREGPPSIDHEGTTTYQAGGGLYWELPKRSARVHARVREYASKS